MRLTTKIILGIILSILIVSLLFIIGFSFSERGNYDNPYSHEISIPQDNPVGINVESYRVIVLEEDKAGIVLEEKVNGIMHIFLSYSKNNSLTLNSITSGEENKLFIPEALYDLISAKTDNDTLTIQIKTYELRKKYSKEGGKEYMSFSGINFCLYTSNVDIINHLDNFSTQVINIETDSMKIVSNGDVLIESCKVIGIDPDMYKNYSKLTVKNSVVQTIYIDLDYIRNLDIEGCDIEVENITGSGKHNIKQHRNETGKINWYPKNKDAVLSITLPGDTMQMVLQ